MHRSFAYYGPGGAQDDAPGNTDARGLAHQSVSSGRVTTLSLQYRPDPLETPPYGAAYSYYDAACSGSSAVSAPTPLSAPITTPPTTPGFWTRTTTTSFDAQWATPATGDDAGTEMERERQQRGTSVCYNNNNNNYDPNINNNIREDAIALSQSHVGGRDDDVPDPRPRNDVDDGALPDDQERASQVSQFDFAFSDDRQALPEELLAPREQAWPDQSIHYGTASDVSSYRQSCPYPAQQEALPNYPSYFHDSPIAQPDLETDALALPDYPSHHRAPSAPWDDSPAFGDSRHHHQLQHPRRIEQRRFSLHQHLATAESPGSRAEERQSHLHICERKPILGGGGDQCGGEKPSERLVIASGKIYDGEKVENENSNNNNDDNADADANVDKDSSLGGKPFARPHNKFQQRDAVSATPFSSTPISDFPSIHSSYASLSLPPSPDSFFSFVIEGKQNTNGKVNDVGGHDDDDDDDEPATLATPPAVVVKRSKKKDDEEEEENEEEDDDSRGTEREIEFGKNENKSKNDNLNNEGTRLPVPAPLEESTLPSQTVETTPPDEVFDFQKEKETSETEEPADRKLDSLCDGNPTFNSPSRIPYFSSNRNRSKKLAFPREVVLVLEASFALKKYLERHERKALADQLGIGDMQVKTWFQNRRMKLKRQLAIKIKAAQIEAGSKTMAPQCKSAGSAVSALAHRQGTKDTADDPLSRSQSATSKFSPADHVLSNGGAANASNSYSAADSTSVTSTSFSTLKSDCGNASASYFGSDAVRQCGSSVASLGTQRQDSTTSFAREGAPSGVQTPLPSLTPSSYYPAYHTYRTYRNQYYGVNSYYNSHIYPQYGYSSISHIPNSLNGTVPYLHKPFSSLQQHYENSPHSLPASTAAPPPIATSPQNAQSTTQPQQHTCYAKPDGSPTLPKFASTFSHETRQEGSKGSSACNSRGFSGGRSPFRPHISRSTSNYSSASFHQPAESSIVKRHNWYL